MRCCYFIAKPAYKRVIETFVAQNARGGFLAYAVFFNVFGHVYRVRFKFHAEFFAKATAKRGICKRAFAADAVFDVYGFDCNI